MRTVDLEAAKALQELGYDGEYTYCHVGVYPKNEYQIMTLTDCEKYRHDVITLCAAPRLDDAAYFIRDKYHISIEPVWCGTDYKWSVAAYDMDYKGIAEYFCVADNSCDSALEAAVKKAIEIIKSRNSTEYDNI